MATDTATRTDTLRPGESLLLYTDGLPDAMDPGDRPFGQDRIQALLEAHREAEPSAILDLIKAAVAGTAPQVNLMTTST